jgi:hypothetical protein
MRLYLLAPLAAIAAGCGAQIADGSGQSGDTTGGRDGGSRSFRDAGAPVCADAVYLNFGGQTLTRANDSDATNNEASWMTMRSGTAPPYLDGVADRDTTIQSIVDGVRAELASIPITVVTDRPATGTYVMVVFGGTAQDVGSRFDSAVAELDCRNRVASDVAWIADSVTPVAHVVNDVIGAIGFGAGLTATSDPEDCMCGWANNCMSDNANACTLGSPIARDQMANQLCSDLDPEDEVAVLHDAFCH